MQIDMQIELHLDELHTKQGNNRRSYFAILPRRIGHLISAYWSNYCTCLELCNSLVRDESLNCELRNLASENQRHMHSKRISYINVYRYIEPHSKNGPFLECELMYRKIIAKTG